MTLSDIIAVLALLTSGGALALEVRRWFESGPKLLCWGDRLSLEQELSEARAAEKEPAAKARWWVRPSRAVGPPLRSSRPRRHASGTGASRCSS